MPNAFWPFSYSKGHKIILTSHFSFLIDADQVFIAFQDNGNEYVNGKQ